jgi:hypothetical protein
MKSDIDEKLREIVRNITEESMPPPRWAIGDMVEHPEGYPVLIVDGPLWEVFPDGGQRLVNRWSWRKVDGKGNAFGTVTMGDGRVTDPSVTRPSFGH